MTSGLSANARYQVRPVTAAGWDELAAFFGPSGAYSNCWCAWWRVSAKEFSTGCSSNGAGNRDALRRLTQEGKVPGLLGYAVEEPDVPLGWVSVGPRPQFGRVARSRNLKPTDEEFEDESVWSVVCFWMPREQRGLGLGTALLGGAVEYAFEQGASAVEGYPVDTFGERASAAAIFTGTVSMFAGAGFTEAFRRGERRPVMRREAPMGAEERKG